MSVGVGEDGYTFADREAAIRFALDTEFAEIKAELAAAREREAVLLARIEDAETDAANARSSRDELLAAAREREQEWRDIGDEYLARAKAAEERLANLDTEGGTAGHGTATGCEVGSRQGGASPDDEVGAELAAARVREKACFYHYPLFVQGCAGCEARAALAQETS